MGEVEQKESMMRVEEEYAEKVIPSDKRRHWFYVGSVYFGMTAVIVVCMTAGGLMHGLSFMNSLIAMVIGLILLFSLFFFPLGKIGAEVGLNTYVLGECAFGTLGSKIATALIITAIPSIAWYGIETEIAVKALASVITIPGGNIGMEILTFIFGILFAIPPMIGITSMAWINWIGIPVMAIIVIYGIKLGLSLAGWGAILSFVPAEDLSLTWGINIQIAALIVGCCFVADYTRWINNSSRDITLAGLFGLFPASILLGLGGMVMALTSAKLGVEQTWNIVDVMVKLDMPGMALILIFMLQWTTCITAAYSSGLALKKLFGGSRVLYTLLSAVIGSILAITGIVNYFLSFLGLIAILIPPVAGAIITEYYFISHRKFKPKSQMIYLPGIISIIIGGFMSYFDVIFIPAITGLLSGSLIYYFVSSLYNRRIQLNDVPQ